MAIKQRILVGLVGVFLGSTAAKASQVPIDTGSYSQLYRSGTTYLIRDKDYNPDLSQFGLFTTWQYRPRGQFQVRAQYCQGDLWSGDAPTLTEMNLLKAGRPLVQLTTIVAAIPAGREVVRPEFYSPGFRTFSPYSYGSRYSLFGGFNTYNTYSAPIYRPAVNCTMGSTVFDLTPIAAALQQLPQETLEVQLIFNNGEIRQWHLGRGTVEALKQLSIVHQQSLENNLNPMP